MGFGNQMQGRESHDALVKIQDTEIRLLENMCSCLQKRIEGDKRYISSLNSFVQHGMKLEETEYHEYCTVFQAWTAVIKGSEQFGEILQRSVDVLSSQVLGKVKALLAEKKAARKCYEDERNRLEKEFTRIKDEVQKNKQDYTKAVEKVRLERAKFEDLSAKGKSNKIEAAKQSYVQASVKLHKLHNKYVISLSELRAHQENYRSKTLPAFLDHHQVNQEILAQQCKDFLDEFQQMTTFGTQEYQDVYASVEKAVKDIKPDQEYNREFTSRYSSEPFSPITFEFDTKLLDDYQGKLIPNKLAVDDFTVESLIHTQSSLKVDIDNMTTALAAMEKENVSLQKRIGELKKQNIENDTEEYNELMEKRKKSEELAKKIAELESSLSTKTEVSKLVSRPLDSLGDQIPPSAMDLDYVHNDTASIHSAEGPAQSSFVGYKKIFKKMKTNLFKSEKSAQNGRPEASSYESNDLHDSSEFVEEEMQHENIRSVSKMPAPPPASPAVKRLEEEEWFHGVLPREEVQRLLVNDGDFLVRESKNKRTNEIQYVLSAYWQGHKHFIIQYHEGGWRFEGPCFPTINDLVNHQYASGQPVTNRSQTILGNPILRESWELMNDDIVLDVKIGNGNFGEVFRGKYTRTGEIVAVKTCKDTLSEEQRKKFLMEGRILKQYDHPNIVKFIGIAAQRQPVMIIMEYVSGGALLSFLRKEGKKQIAQKKTEMCLDAACGMAYLSEKGCIHRDLAARNCLVGASNVVKISDFGMSREEEEYTVSDGMKQIPIKWTAPEALNYGRYTTQCDVWSYGILMWEIFSNGLTPYPGWTNAIARESVEQGYRMPAPTGTPDCAYQIMLKCWDKNPQTRITFADLYAQLKELIDTHKV